MRRYQTSIKPLLEAKTSYFLNNGVEPVFLSDWDSDYNAIKIPDIALDSGTVHKTDLQKYYFWTDEENFRNSVQDFFLEQFKYNLSKDTFAVGMNGTSCMMLALNALKEIGKHRALVFTPVYFATLNLLDSLEYDVVEYNLYSAENFSIDTKKLEFYVKQYNIDTIVLTSPLFGTGVELSEMTVREIAAICNTYGVCLIMDYIYGGLTWDITSVSNRIFNFPIYNAIKSAEHYIFIESISKRIFLNGAKIALIFSSASLLRRILRLSVFTVGSMAFQQVNLIPKLYSNEHVSEISNHILHNASLAKRRFEMIKSITADSSMQVSDANCGYFILASVPNISAEDDLSLALKILERTGVLTTPHSRYLHKEKDRYFFRINLLLKLDDLLIGISRIKNLK